MERPTRRREQACAPGTPPGKTSLKEWQRTSTAYFWLTSGPNRESQVSVAAVVVVVTIFCRVAHVRDKSKLTFLLRRKLQPGLDVAVFRSYLFAVETLASSSFRGKAGCLVGRHQGDCDMSRIQTDQRHRRRGKLRTSQALGSHVNQSPNLLEHTATDQTRNITWNH